MANVQVVGRCLCRTITYSINGQLLGMGQCHCKDCQRASGTGHMSLARFKTMSQSRVKRAPMDPKRRAATSKRRRLERTMSGPPYIRPTR
jgi:hypothetical protein